MSKAQLVITAVVMEGRSKTDVARNNEVSRQWVHQPGNASAPTVMSRLAFQFEEAFGVLRWRNMAP